MTFSSDDLAATGLAVVGVVLIFYVIRTIVRNIHSGIDFIEGWFRGVAKPEMASHERISFMEAFGTSRRSCRLRFSPGAGALPASWIGMDGTYADGSHHENRNSPNECDMTLSRQRCKRISSRRNEQAFRCLRRKPVCGRRHRTADALNGGSRVTPGKSVCIVRSLAGPPRRLIEVSRWY